MDLRDWRKARGLSLEKAAPLFGLHLSGLSDLERGDTAGIQHATLARIEAVTNGEVTAADLHRAWRFAHPQEFTEARAAGRRARASIPKTRPTAGKRKTAK